MRITSGMIQNQVIFNMQRSISDFMRVQTNMSSGRRINRPSDDPTGTLRDLNYRTELARNAQFQSNVNNARSWMGAYDTNMSDMKNFVSEAKEVAVAMSNGIYDATARNATAVEIRSIADQLLQLGNTEHGGQRMYGGYNLSDQPFQMTANGVIYRGDQGDIQFEVESTLKMSINFTGDNVLLAPTSILGSEADLNISVTGDTLLGDLNAGDSIDLTAGTFTIRDENLDITATIDLTAAPALTDTSTVNDLLARINADLAANVPPVTNLTAVLSPAGTGIMLDSTENGLISGVTSLDKLNQGNGVDMNVGQIVISDGGAINETVNFNGASSVQEIIDAFNNHFIAAGMPQVTMAINAAGTGFEINDTTGPPSLGLSISEAALGSTTAEDLGIAGDIGSQLIGTDLNPIVSFTVADTTGTTAANLGIVGTTSGDLDGADLNPNLVLTGSLSSLNNGNGVDMSEIVIWQGGSRANIDLSSPTITTVQDLIDAFNMSGLDITASINPDGTGIQVENNDSTMSLTIEEMGDGRSAKDLGIFGAGDIMGSLIVLGNALENDDQEGTGLLLENLDAGIDHLLEYRGAVGSRALRLETTANRLLDQSLTFTTLLSEVEDADITSLVTELATREATYQASLMAGAKIIQPSLMNFLS